jgi:hypothetical protein
MKKNAAPGKQTEVTTTITRKEDRNKNRTQSTKQNHSISIGTKSIINNVQSLIQSTKQFKQKRMFNQQSIKQSRKNRKFQRGRKASPVASRFRKGEESYSVRSRDRESFAVTGETSEGGIKLRQPLERGNQSTNHSNYSYQA